jgi:hypothetical protein
MSEGVESNDSGGTGASDLSGISNVLLLVPSLQSHSRGVCLDLLTQTPPEQTSVLAITYTETAGGWIDAWTEGVGLQPVRGGVVSVGQSGVDVDEPSWATTGVENPSDLTGIGIELSELLSQMEAAGDEDEQIAVCYDSVTTLLQYADLQRVFRFLHVVTGRIKSVDGVGHFHLDPGAHDDQTLATLKGLFDAVVEVDEDGSWEIRQ